MAHLAPAPAAGAAATKWTASVGLAVLEPELLVHALLFVDHAEAIRTASTCKALRCTLLGPSCPDAGFLWRSSYRRRWLFGLRRRHRPPQQQTAFASAMGIDFLAYRTRHEQARHMAEGKAGQYRVQTVRPPGSGRIREFCGVLLESETNYGVGSDAAGGAEGPVAYVGTSTGQVMRMGCRPQRPDGGKWVFGALWEASTPQRNLEVRVMARKGDVLACGTYSGQVFFLHAGTGQPLPQAGEGAAPGDFSVIETGLIGIEHLLWLEGGQRLVVASGDSNRVHLYCPRTGRLCQDIAPPADGSSYWMKALVQRPPGDGDGDGDGDGGPDQRPHFLVLYGTMARFFVQDTAAETPDADSTGTNFRPYSEHGRVLPPGAYFECAVLAPAVGGFPSDEEAGAYRVFLGTHGRGIHTAAFFVHPRIRLAQLFHADGGIVSPLRALTDDQAFVKALEVRSVQVPKPEGGPGSDLALLVGTACPGWLRVWSLHEPVRPPDGTEEPVFAGCQIMAHHIPAPVGSALALYMDDEKVLVSLDGTTVQVFILPRDPPPYPVSFDPTPVRGRFSADCEPLYCLRGGSASLPYSDVEIKGLAVGAAEVLVAYENKVRLYDFTPL